MSNDFETGFQAGVIWAKYHPDQLKQAGETIRTLKGRGLSDAEVVRELLTSCLEATSTQEISGPGPGSPTLEERNT